MLDAEHERGEEQNKNEQTDCDVTNGRRKKKKNWLISRRERPRVEKEETEQYAQHKVQAVRLQRLIKTVDDWQEKRVKPRNLST